MKKQRLFYDDPSATTVPTSGGNNSWLNSLFGNLGSAFSGIGDIVRAANTKTEVIDETRDITNKNSFTWTNGTTVAAVVMGGVVICVILALTLKNK